MLIVDGSGTIVLANALAEKLFGYDQHQLTGCAVEVLVPERYRRTHPAHRTAFFEHPTQRAMGGGRELHALRKDGLEVPVEIGLSPFSTAHGDFVLASIVDISVRKKAEERVRAALEAAPVAILMVDRSGTIVKVNAQAERIFGYPRSELVGKAMDILVPHAVRARHPDFRAGFFANPAPRAMGAGRDLHALRMDGREVPVEIGLSPVVTDEGTFVLAAIIDISERKAAEEAKDRLLGAITNTAQELSTTAAQMLAGTTQQASGAHEQVAGVSQTVNTVDEVTRISEQTAQWARVVADSSQRTVEISRAGREAVDEAVTVMADVKRQVESLAAGIVELAEHAQQIRDIIGTVNEIAEQTNLLALNAAIEAARAGEQGKGFSVVATEVKALADQSKRATTQVRQILGNIEKATNSVAMATEDETKSVNGAIKVVDRAGETIRILGDTINDSARAALQIAESASQQSVGMAQIHHAMSSISQVTSQNLTAMKQGEEAARNLDALGQRLRALLVDFGR